MEKYRLVQKPSRNVLKNNLEQQISNTPTIYYDYFYRWLDFTLRYNNALFEAALESCKSFLDSDWRIGESKKILKKMRTTFDSKLRRRLCDEDIASSIANFVDAWLNVVKFTGYEKYHRNYANILSTWSSLFASFRNMDRTPSELIRVKGKFNLHHYKPIDGKKIYNTPLLVVYSLINRYYILDLMPNASIINNLRKQGFDIYTTDWGTPDYYDKDMTLENYAHEYVENAVDKIKEITGSDKVSLFGYCWGGVFALIYSAIHPETVKNLILHATPVDLSQEKVVVENWTAHLDADKLVDTLGNVPGWFVNLAFVLRNPVEMYLKYFMFFAEPRSPEKIRQFFWIESWLYDSRPIIGEAYREIVNKISKNNLLIQNKMRIGHHIIDLRKITVPVLNIVGSEDDLVPTQSSKPINLAIGSKDKKLIVFPTGHVGLCIGQKAHQQLWPEVGAWLAKRS